MFVNEKILSTSVTYCIFCIPYIFCMNLFGLYVCNIGKCAAMKSNFVILHIPIVLHLNPFCSSNV